VTLHDDLLHALRSVHTLQAKLSVLETALPVPSGQADRLLAGARERDLMVDDALKLLKIASLHEAGRRAEQEYYVCSIADADARARLRRSLGMHVECLPARVIMLVTVDCLRADRLSCNGCCRPTTPAIDCLAAEGVNFPRAYSTAGQTAQSFPGILLSNFYQNFGRSRSVPEELTTLAEAFSASGFHTVGFNAANPHISHFYRYDRGFDEFSDYIGPQNVNPQETLFTDHSDRRVSAVKEQEVAAVVAECRAHPDTFGALKDLTGLSDSGLVQHIVMSWRFYPYKAADIVRYAIHSLMEDDDRRDRFYWLHLMDVHENIAVPYSRLGAMSMIEQTFLNVCLGSPLGLRVLAAQPDKYGQLYDIAVSYVDVQVEILRNFLQDAGLLDASLLCLTADHGQELLENGAFGHGYDRLVEALVHRSAGRPARGHLTGHRADHPGPVRRGGPGELPGHIAQRRAGAPGLRPDVLWRRRQPLRGAQLPP
jgi:hypothetical protein